MYPTEHVWSLKNSLTERVLSSCHAVPKDGIQVVKVGRKPLYPLSQLTGPDLFKKKQTNKQIPIHYQFFSHVTLATERPIGTDQHSLRGETLGFQDFQLR